MHYKTLINQSKEHLGKHPEFISVRFPATQFSTGAKWMLDRLNEMEGVERSEFNQSINYNTFGIFKYGISLLAWLISGLLFYQINVALTPLSVLVFYFFEIHFLFLFPILIGGSKRPVLVSIRETYKVGVIRALLTVIPIGIHMVVGLLNLKNPLYNWHVGCLAIVIWYQHEIRDRV